MKMQEVTITLTEKELDFLTYAIGEYQSRKFKKEVDELWSQLYEIRKNFKREAHHEKNTKN